MGLPRTNYHLLPDNPVEQIFWGKTPLVRATSFFFYRKGSAYKYILHRLKYGGEKEIGEIMGRYVANELLPCGFFKDIDLIIPVPLHRKRQRARGYNQSEWIARGIVSVTGLLLDAESVVRDKFTETQTHKSKFERWENVSGFFSLTKHADELAGKHLLIVDDVLTTGATIVSVASCLSAVEDVRISVLTLAIASS
ncbi:phosphoribosyltransferase domain protein [Bacteroides reticulotermitis JCM 10512]|uniref:Phosphoribosyltransferase domain protein n=2 Tax=Bacteroides reticulotermitis TaxID=1133319 RepID=W4UWH5_9BACE|nr:phosphoribosyltransferase domain protein [Bacteroides reticulotermitis JCM 10512]